MSEETISREVAKHLLRLRVHPHTIYLLTKQHVKGDEVEEVLRFGGARESYNRNQEIINMFLAIRKRESCANYDSKTGFCRLSIIPTPGPDLTSKTQDVPWPVCNESGQIYVRCYPLTCLHCCEFKSKKEKRR